MAMPKFDTPAPISTVLHVPAGSVRLVAAERADTTVEIQPADPSKGRDVHAAEHTTVEYADGVLRIQAGDKGSLAVTIHLPSGSGVEGKAGATELSTTGPLGEVAFDGAYREIKIDQAAGLRLAAVDGDVEVARLGGPAEISTARGDIRIAEALGGTVVLTTQSGDISIAAAPGVSASLDAGTSSGRVSNSLKNDGSTGLDIRATTAHGDITARSL